MSTLFVNNLNTASGDTITVPTGKKLVVTDTGGLAVPNQVLNIYRATVDANASGASQNTWYDSPVTITFTPLTASSIFLVWYNCGVSMADGSGDGGTSLRLKRVHNGTTSYPAGISTDTGNSGNRHSWFYSNQNPSSVNIYSMATVHGVDTDSHVVSSIVYTVQFAAYNTGNTTVGNSYGGRSIITVMEIAQ